MSQAGVAEETAYIESDAPFKVEQHGINAIPLSDRHGHPRELFWLWCGSLMGIVDFIIGAVVIGLGLSVFEAISAIIIGDLSYLLVGLIATNGPDTGTSTIVISRAPFGIRGNALPTLLSWLTIVGWEGVNAVTGVLTLVAMFKTAGLGDGNGVKAVSIVIFMAAMVIWAVFGHATIVVVQRIFTYLLTIGLVGVFYFGLQHVNWHFTGQPVTGNHITTWIWAIGIVAAANGFGFANMPADYTRYMPRSVSKRAIVTYTFWGTFLPTTVLQIGGALIGTKLNMYDPVGSLTGVMPHWFLVPFLAVAAVTMVAANVMNMYSSGLNLLALGIRIPRYLSVLFDAVFVTAFVWVALFMYNYVNTYTGFLSLTIWWVTPWTAIYLIDLYRRKFQYRSEDLLRPRGGLYWYRDGVNWNAVISLVGGAIAAALFTNSTLFVSPISKAIGGLDISIFTGFCAGAILYWFLGSRQTERQDQERREPAFSAR